VPGASHSSSGASEGCHGLSQCGLIVFTSADLNIAITTLKHLPLLDRTSCMGSDSKWVGAASETKNNYPYVWIHYCQ
jgi:hypothetical protein